MFIFHKAFINVQALIQSAASLDTIRGNSLTYVFCEKWLNRVKMCILHWVRKCCDSHCAILHCFLSGQSHFCSRGTTSTQHQTLKVPWSSCMQRLAQRSSTDTTGGLFQRLRQEKSPMCSDTTLLWVYLCIVTEDLKQSNWPWFSKRKLTQACSL